jgi:hypothetical protein
MYILNFLQILQKSIEVTTSSISKTREILLRFKMVAVLKMAVKKYFFDYSSVYIKYY